MDKQRAKELLETKTFGSLRMAFRDKSDSPGKPIYKDGITPDEDAFIRRVWAIMPGSCSYYDAVCSIAKGLAETPYESTMIVTNEKGLGTSVLSKLPISFNPSSLANPKKGEIIKVGCVHSEDKGLRALVRL